MRHASSNPQHLVGIAHNGVVTVTGLGSPRGVGKSECMNPPPDPHCRQVPMLTQHYIDQRTTDSHDGYPAAIQSELSGKVLHRANV
jgi:hypothetical protein